MNEFTGTERYKVVRRLGKGGMGAVYEVHDTHRDLNVALKTLNLSSREGAETLKREFRAVAGLRHPHLVTLYDLVVTRENAFFTMEIVPGEDLASYVRPFTERMPGRAAGVPRGIGYDPKRLLAVLPQVLAGLDALHGAGFVHRDLKPANILVTHEGQVKILDFGIAQAIHSFTFEDGSEAVGTPQYMSPEQAFGRRAGPEADLYALGCILFVLLTGRYPFDFEDDLEILKAQAHTPAPHARDLVPQVPLPLDRLCHKLMQKEPSERPTAREAVRYLVAEMGAREPVWYQARTPTEVPFVGREAELQAVLDAAVAVERGEGRVILVGGDSGVGKSLLVQEAIKMLRARATRWGHYASRCYEREDLPYKAFDGIVELIAMTLERRDKNEVHAFLPKGIEALARIFPVLWEVSAISEIPAVKNPDRRAERERAFFALREILSRLARVRPLCLVLDDLQWADPESVQLLLSIMGEPTPAPILLLATARTREIGEGHPLWPFLERASQGGNVRLELRLFGRREVAELLRRYLKREPPPPVVERILRESRGIPYLVAELARAFAENPTGAALELTTILKARIAALSPEAHAVLDCAAISGGLSDFKLLKSATGISSAVLVSALDELIEARLLREAYHPHQDEVYDVYHNRIRELVYAQTPPERRRALHQAIARALEEQEGEGKRSLDYDRLSDHWGRAGDLKRAFSYTLRAASQAVEKLAFSHAADLYAKAKELAKNEEGIDLRSLHEARAEVLDLSGRYQEASAEFTAAARQYHGLERAHLVLRAAEADLKSGDLGRGIAGLNAILAAVDGQNIKKSNTRIAFSMLRHKWEGEIRTRFYRIDKKRQPGPEEALRLELYHRLAGHYFVFDIFRGAEYQEKLFARALRVGDPNWAAKAFYSHSIFLASSFIERYMKQAVRFFTLGDQIVEEAGIDDPFVSYLALACRAVYYLCDNQWEKCLECFRYAVERHWEEIGQRSFERAVANSYTARTEFYAGMLDAADARLKKELSRARERRDRYTLSELAWSRMRVALYKGNLTRAAAARDESLYIWPEEPYSLQRLRMEAAAGEIALGEGDLEGARARLEGLLANGSKNSLNYLKWDHGEVSLLLSRVLCAMAARQEGSAKKALLDRAQSLLKSPLSLPRRFLYALALRQRAVIELLRQKPKNALPLLDKALAILGEVKGDVEEAAALLLRARVRGELGLPDEAEDRARGLRLLETVGAWDPAEREGGAWTWK